MQNYEPAEGTDGSESVLQFLPVNQTVSPAEATRQRAYLSCDACRQRKTRCVSATPGQRHPCRRCVADGKSCQFRNSRAVGARRANRGRLSRRNLNSPSLPPTDPTNNSILDEPVAVPDGRAIVEAMAEDQRPQPEYSTPFEPLDDRSAPDGYQTICDIEASRSASTGSPQAVKATTQRSARSRIISTRLHDTTDALDLLTLAAAGVQSEAEDPSTRGRGHFSHPDAASSHSTNAAGESWPQLTDETDWKRFILIKNGVLTKLEVVEYLEFYFSYLWPLRPVVHRFYRDSARFALLAVEEPLLLTCLVTLASRYHALSGAHGEIRSERIHWQAWRLLQKYLQSALWGSPVTRSLGAIVAMLLMIEWHSKSINNPLGLSDGDDYELFNVPEPGQRYGKNDPDLLSSSANRQRFGMSTLLEKLNIVAPAYRSNKMSWMLLANAIALAQESDCFKQDPRESQGVSSGYETFKHEWNQLVCVFIYLADESLSMRLGLETLLPEKSIDVVRTRFSSSFASLLPESMMWESYYELTFEARKARELLQSLKRAGPTVAASAILPDLEHIERGLCRWRRVHSYAVEDTSSLLYACLELEYQYLVMYSFAPASHVPLNSADCGGPTETPAHCQRSEALLTFAHRATSASREMLNTLVNILGPSRMLKYVPVRCWQFIVAANLHLLKTTLTAEVATTGAHDDVRLLRASIVAIRDGSPDDTHMAMRYARFLEIMFNTSYHFSRAETPTRTGDEPSSSMRNEFGQPDFRSRVSPAPYITSLNDFNVPDIVDGLGDINDLFDWTDQPLSIMFGT